MLIVLLIGMMSLERVVAKEITVAVAANFHSTIKELKKHYEQKSPHRLIIVPGSTGKLYAQIMNGAPFDLFMSADKLRPVLLEKDLIKQTGQRFTYAVGRLALWSAQNNLVDQNGDILQSATIHKIAIANPQLAPYGRAAQEVLESLNLDELKAKLVLGESVSQAFHLTSNGSAELGFIALAQLKDENKPVNGSYWIVPEKYHRPIEQQAIILSDNEVVKSFVDFLKSKQARDLITSLGYQTFKLQLADNLQNGEDFNYSESRLNNVIK